jgi:hypothetical protein
VAATASAFAFALASVAAFAAASFFAKLFGFLLFLALIRLVSACSAFFEAIAALFLAAVSAF